MTGPMTGASPGLVPPRELALRIGVLLAVTAVGAGLLFLVQGPTIASSRLTHRIWNLGHIGLFGSLTALSFWVLKERLQPRSSWVIHAVVIGAVALVGGISEGLQTWFAREASWSDAGRNLVGALLATAFLCPGRPLNRRETLGLRVLAVSLLIVALLPLMRTAADEFLRAQQFPVLSDFTTRFERDRWVATYGSEAQITDELSEQTGGKVLRVDLGSRQYAGIALSCPFGDFSKFKTLRIRIFNSASIPLDVACRINDLEHNNEWWDRFSEKVDLEPGWNELSFDVQTIRDRPRDRQMNMAEIRVLMLFRPRPSLPETIYISKVWLE